MREMNKFNSKNSLFTFKGFSFLSESGTTDDPSKYSSGSYNLDEINRRIRKAVLWININKGFYAYPLSNLNIFGSATIDPPTMCTDGENIIFHPDFVARHTDEAIRLVLIHEVLHCLNSHHERRGNRDPRKWNIACDYAINPLLMDESGLEFPKDSRGQMEGLYEEKFAGMRAEDIYDLLESDEDLMDQIMELYKKAKDSGLVKDEGELSDEEII
jgi:predicted metal-dependent peptidase